MVKLFDIGVLFCLILCTCTNTVQDIAGTSEQENARITATIVTSNGTPAAGATVRLRRADYVKPLVGSNRNKRIAVNVHTDGNGSFLIDSIDTGFYSIEVTDTISDAVLLQCTIDDFCTFSLDTDTLRPFAAIKGSLSGDFTTAQHFIQIEGLERLITIENNGSYTLTDLPAGVLTIKSISSEPAVDPIVIPDVVTRPAQTTRISGNDWHFSQSIYLNTTATGAGVSEDVYEFPVLVRFNESTFNFNDVPDDMCLRFIKADNDSTPLPFEIERWDRDAQRAEIWVLVDTVYGNNGKQSFVMLWGGNTPTTEIVRVQEVFDTANGFCGVWHLGETHDNTIKDATANSYNGTPTAVRHTEGLIGNAGTFSSTDKSYIVMSNTASGKLNIPENGTYSIALWVNADSLSHNRVMIGKGDVQYYIRIHNNKWRFSEFQANPATGWEITESPCSFHEWVHLYGVRNNNKQYLYVNGLCVDSTIFFDGEEIPRDESFDLEIGRRLLPDRSDGLYFSGSLDEIRISNTVRNSAWIRLNYMNQRNDNKLVTCGK